MLRMASETYTLHWPKHTKAWWGRQLMHDLATLHQTVHIWAGKRQTLLGYWNPEKETWWNPRGPVFTGLMQCLKMVANKYDWSRVSISISITLHFVTNFGIKVIRSLLTFDLNSEPGPMGQWEIFTQNLIEILICWGYKSLAWLTCFTHLAWSGHYL